MRDVLPAVALVAAGAWIIFRIVVQGRFLWLKR